MPGRPSRPPRNSPSIPPPPVWHRRRPVPGAGRGAAGPALPRDREILLLFYEEGLSYQEIAQRLGVPVSTCGTWLSRARKHCRAYLSHSPGFPD
ncbi:MAG: RNA polymerase sigma factor [Evtepia gabavorous]